MKRFVLTCLAGIAAAPALADPGLHHHPHGITAGWIVVAAVLIGAPVVAMVVKRIGK